MKRIGKTKIIAVAFGVCGLLLFGYTVSVISNGVERTEEVKGAMAEYRRSGLQLSDFPAGWLDELLLIEDPGFWMHHGVDLYTPGAGITTITQGLVKLHYFDRFKPGLAKYKQSVLALVLNQKVSKEDQLLLFVNTASFGHYGGGKIRGFTAAAQAYFGKRFVDLEHAEYLALVTMLIGPAKYNMARQPENHRIRFSRVQNFLKGECAPDSVFDVEYENCESA